MKNATIYLDTSIISFLLADDAPDKRDLTREFFETYVRLGLYDVWVSPVVITELQKTPDPARQDALLAIIDDYNIEILEIEANRDEIGSLARAYVRAGVIPERKTEDALHVAIATVNEFDILLSWNYRHLANVNKEARIKAVNLQAGYMKTLRLLTPLEVMYDDKD